MATRPRVSRPELYLPGKHIHLHPNFQTILDPNIRDIFMGSGRSTGKTFGVSQMMLILGMKTKIRVLFTRDIQLSLKESCKWVVDYFIDAMELGDFYTSTENSIKGKNGTEFLFMGLGREARNIRSVAGIDICVVDEAQQVKEPAFRSLIRTIRKQGSKMIYLFNPEDEDDEVYLMAMRAEGEPKSVVFWMTYRDNWFNPQTILDVRATDERLLSAEVYDHIWEGKLKKRADSAVITNWEQVEIESSVEPGGDMIVRADGEVYTVKIPSNAKVIMGADWGYKHPTVLIRALVWERNIYITHEAFAREIITNEVPALFAGNDYIDPQNPRWQNPKGYKGVPNALATQIIADSSEPDRIAEVATYGFKIKPARKGPNSINDGVSFLQSRKIFVRKDCKESVYELGRYSYKIDKQTKEVIPDQIEDAFNHCMDALRYACEPLRVSANPPQEKFGGYGSTGALLG